ncbi:hypothetical protein BH11BAC6_BH11BAC6_15180 [soil metagenome]
MKNKLILFIIALYTLVTVDAQNTILKPPFLNVEIDSLKRRSTSIKYSTIYTNLYMVGTTSRLHCYISRISFLQACFPNNS